MICWKIMLDVFVALPSSLEWIAMKRHLLEVFILQHYFDTQYHAIAMLMAKKAGDTLQPVNDHVERVCKNGGRSGDGQQLPAEIQQRVDKLWLDI
jgi:hypothetical protein